MANKNDKFVLIEEVPEEELRKAQLEFYKSGSKLFSALYIFLFPVTAIVLVILSRYLF